MKEKKNQKNTSERKKKEKKERKKNLKRQKKYIIIKNKINEGNKHYTIIYTNINIIQNTNINITQNYTITNISKHHQNTITIQ